MTLKIEAWNALVANRPSYMKPLLEKEINAFMQRFDNFRDAEFRSLKVVSPSEIRLIFGVQDRARAFDWISLEVEFLEIKDAKLLNFDKVKLVSMDEGATFLKSDSFAFCIGKYSDTTNMKDSIAYVICDSIKYKEGTF
jgi:hypothetical protein